MAEYGGDHASIDAVRDALPHYIGRGLDPEKVMCGIPFYGRTTSGWAADYNNASINGGTGSQAAFEGSITNNYYYDGTQATFTLIGFSVSSAQCTIAYSCTMAPTLAHDLCSYTGGTTTATFNAANGDYSISSQDNGVFGT